MKTVVKFVKDENGTKVGNKLRTVEKLTKT